MDEFQCEILIIGAGPAGLSAGVYCGRSGRDTIILEGKQPSALEEAKDVLNYPGYERIKGIELLKQFRTHAENHESVRIISGEIIALMVGMGRNMISTRNANITADAVIIATGRGARKERIKGEEALNGYGVSYCALCDGPLYKEKTVFLYGNDEEMVEEGLILQQMGCKVNLISPLGSEELPEKIKEAKEASIGIFEKMQIIEIIKGEHLISKIICKDLVTEDIKEFELDCLFILSHVPSNSIFKKAGVELDEKGNVKVNKEQETSVKGVYAAGDVTGGLFQVVFATAEGSRAGINAAKYIRGLKKD